MNIRLSLLWMVLSEFSKLKVDGVTAVPLNSPINLNQRMAPKRARRENTNHQLCKKDPFLLLFLKGHAVEDLTMQ